MSGFPSTNARLHRKKGYVGFVMRIRTPCGHNTSATIIVRVNI